VDDSKQGDGNATNATHTAKFDAAGNLIQYDGKGTATGAGLINFQTEDVRASTVVLEFPFGGSATYPAPPGGYIPTPIGSIPVGPAGTTTTIGGVRIRFENANAEGGMIILGSELVGNPQALPEMGETLDMDLNVDVALMDPYMPSLVSAGIHIEHLQEDGLFGRMLPVVEGEDYYFLDNFIMGGSFFDITYIVEMDDQAPQVFRLHCEVSEEFLESAWFVNVLQDLAIPPDPEFPPESFFDVFCELEVMPEAYLLLTEPGMTNLLEWDLTAVQFSDLPGDANFDGRVDEEDATILASNWLTLDGTASWSDGDFNGDGNVDETDASLMAGNWLVGVAPPASAPEPGTIALIVLGLMVCLTGRYSNRKN
jgi:hypothetical protein